MIAMLQVLIYELDSKPDKLVPSELSRLLPSNFYGNRISFDGMHLFKPWQGQYQEYTAKANDILYTCSETFEYKYEVSLDLEDFFPSIYPQVLFLFITKYLPLRFKDNEEKTLRMILKKLLIFELSSLNSTEIGWYLKCNSSKRSLKYAKGIPQGLPHTCFMANIFMIMVQEEYKKYFPGKMLFYVDDSVIFTNGINGEINKEIFAESVKSINESIHSNEQYLLKNAEENNWILPKDYSYKYEEPGYGVQVHSPDDQNPKSVFSPVPNAKKDSGELYLKSLSRETSNMTFDIFTIFSDAEVQMISNRTNIIFDAINEEINKINKDDLTKNVYYQKLLRYKKFFSYRKTWLDYRNTGDILKLKTCVLSDIKLRKEKKLNEFYEKYNDDILAANIQFVFKRCTEESINTKDLIRAVKKLNTLLYGKDDQHSYVLQSYRPYLEKKPDFFPVDYYYTLQNSIATKFSYLREQSEKMKRKYVDEIFGILNKDNCESLFVMLGLKGLYDQSIYVRCSSRSLLKN